jgi:hypothetical protein
MTMVVIRHQNIAYDQGGQWLDPKKKFLPVAQGKTKTVGPAWSLDKGEGVSKSDTGEGGEFCS